MSLSKFEALYLEGLRIAKADGGRWPQAYLGIRTYLETVCPGYSVPQLLINHGMIQGRVRPQSARSIEHHAHYARMVRHVLDKALGYGHQASAGHTA